MRGGAVQGADSVNDTEGEAVGVGIPIIEGREEDDEIYINIWEFAAGGMTKDELDVFLDEAAKCKFTRHCNCPNCYCSDPRAPLDGPRNFPIEFGYDNSIPNPHDPNGNLRMSEMIHIFDLYDEGAEIEWAERIAVDDAVAEREAAEQEWAELNHTCAVGACEACEFAVSVSRKEIFEPDSDHSAGYISMDYSPSPSPDNHSAGYISNDQNLEMEMENNQQLPVNEDGDVGGGRIIQIRIHKHLKM